MKHIFSALLIVAALVLALPACTNNDNYTIETSSDCIVTAATLGKLIRVQPIKTKDGRDSTYNEYVTGAYYPLYIDQLNNIIYNGDSLPTNIDLSRITFEQMNAIGTLSINRLDGEGDTIFSGKDTTDLRQPRLITVTASDGSTKRVYKLQLNMHQEEADSFRWTRICTQHPALTNIERARSIAANGRLYAFGTENNTPYLFTATAEQPEQWERIEISIAGESSAAAFNAASVQWLNSTFYALNNNTVVCSTDGINWEKTDSDLAPEALVGAGSNHLVAIANGEFYSSPNGKQWTLEARDTDGPLPNAEYASNCIPSLTDPTFEDILLIGQADGVATVWKHNIDLTGGESFAWTYYPAAKDNPYNCPVVTSPSLFTYDNASLLVALGKDKNAVDFYTSRDNGRTWKLTGFQCPKGMARPTAVSAFSDKENFIWLICSGTGEVWRGRLNRLGWKDVPTSFLKNQQP